MYGLRRKIPWIVVLGLMVVVAVGLSAIVVSAADVDVYAEGAYTENDLAVFIYADINVKPILSGGVKLTYLISELTVVSAEKNEEDWYMGDGTPLGNKPYMDPDTSTPGEVVIIVGKLDSNSGHALDGVSGERILLGKVRFDRTESSIPFSPELDITYGKGGDYKNFVATDEEVLDDKTGGVNFGSITVRERGDANGDGVVDVSDIDCVIDIIFGIQPQTPGADCNEDGVVDVSDIDCIIDKIFGV